MVLMMLGILGCDFAAAMRVQIVMEELAVGSRFDIARQHPIWTGPEETQLPTGGGEERTVQWYPTTERSNHIFGITLESLWDHFGITLGSLRAHFGLTFTHFDAEGSLVERGWRQRQQCINMKTDDRDATTER